MISFVGAAKSSTPEGFADAVAIIGCEAEALEAVIRVETGSRGFDARRRPKALFEPHVFYRLLKKRKDRSGLSKAVSSGLAYPKWGTRPYPSDSYPRIQAACEIDEELALQATSWGLPQILGMNCEAAGYRSAKEMVEAFREGEDAHLVAMARFIARSGLSNALKRKDWASFAKGYNGPAYAVHRYDRRLEEAYSHFVAKGRRAKADALSAEAKNAAQAQHSGKVARRAAGAAVLALAVTPVATSTSALAHSDGIEAILVASIFACAGLLAAALAWRAWRRAAAFK